jgi:hypothetical protein
MHRQTTCTCQACRNIPSLDLKFITHHGDYIQQPVGGITELAGSDVNLIHRLAKNHVVEATGWKAYALFTEASLEHMQVLFEKAHLQPEAYEHLGEVQTHSIDLHERYRELVDDRRIFITAHDADYVCIQDFPAPPSVVWQWLNDPRSRNIWAEGHGVWHKGIRPAGRTGPGSRNHCAHGEGKGEAIETVLDWRPFDYYSAETLDGGIIMTETIQLEPLTNGTTRMHDHLKVKMPLPHMIARPLFIFMFNYVIKYRDMMAGAARLLGEQLNPTPSA